MLWNGSSVLWRPWLFLPLRPIHYLLHCNFIHFRAAKAADGEAMHVHTSLAPYVAGAVQLVIRNMQTSMKRLKMRYNFHQTLPDMFFHYVSAVSLYQLALEK